MATAREDDAAGRPRKRPARRIGDAIVIGLEVLAIVGASVIGLNDWADSQATTASPHTGSTAQVVGREAASPQREHRPPG